MLGDPPGGGVDAELLQRVEDLASRADGDRVVQHHIQVVDAGILSALGRKGGAVRLPRRRQCGGGGTGRGQVIMSSGEQAT